MQGKNIVEKDGSDVNERREKNAKLPPKNIKNRGYIFEG